MKRIEKRAVVCVVLALCLAAGMGLFLVRYFTNGGSWVSSAFNRHLYNQAGQLASGSVLDRDGDVLTTIKDGKRVNSSFAFFILLYIRIPLFTS